MPVAPPTLRYPIGDTVVPGDRIGSTRLVQAGPGTRVAGEQIYASLVGTLRLHVAEDDKYTCSVDSPSNAKSLVLHVGQLVIGRVLRITPQNAIVQISLIEGLGPSPVSIEGAIRMEDVRSGASEQLAIEDCFQPSDMVACRVISLGDTWRYYLTTAEVELGVLRAICKTSGQVMVPISWKEMQCPVTGAIEHRKCAKPGGIGKEEEGEVPNS